MRFTISLTKRLLLFACISIVGYLICSVLAGLAIYKFGMTVPVVRILTVAQDIFVFILPAILIAILITRLPATFLCADRIPSPNVSAWGIITLTVSIPAMEWLIAWNGSITLPESLRELETVLRESEKTAGDFVEMVLGGYDTISIVMGVLIVGILAGFSEEIFFRGTLQRMLTTGRLNRHVAVWITAFIFSAFHFQFYGFAPRLLLGALFGYALIWSGSLWVPVILHAFNNSVYVVTRGLTEGAVSDTTGMPAEMVFNPWLVCASVILTAISIYMMWRTSKASIGRHHLRKDKD